jgi:large subunit ribosomal protein L28
MSRICEICNKGAQSGNQMTIRGKQKYLGGIGTKVTGITARKFYPNLQRVRAVVEGKNTTLRVCTQCIRSGRVTKPVKARPFALPDIKAH